MKTTGLMLFTILGVAACSTYVDKSFVGTLGETPALSGGTYTSGGGVTVAVDIREQEGQTLVCGAWAQSREQSILTKGRSRNVVTKASVSLDGEVIVRAPSFLREVEPASDYAGSEANCRLTERPWQAGDEMRNLFVRIPGHMVFREVDDVGGGVMVVFSPTGPSAGDS